MTGQPQDRDERTAEWLPTRTRTISQEQLDENPPDLMTKLLGEAAHLAAPVSAGEPQEDEK